MSVVTYAMPFQEPSPQWPPVVWPRQEEWRQEPRVDVDKLKVYRFDLEHCVEADLVAEVLRRVLSGTLAPKSRELLEHALTKCESMKNEP